MLAYYIIQGKRGFLSVILILVLFSLCDARGLSGNATSEHFSSANFLARSYIIKASAGPGGSIDPSGDVRVKRDGKITFTITADPGYDILDVLVDGESQGPVSKYEFTKVKENHTIEALFIIRTFTITPTAGVNGSIEPSEPTVVERGSDLEFTITPNTGYGIEDVLVDEVSVGPVTSYTFTDISADHSISATFMAVIEVFDVSIDNVPMRIYDVITTTIIVEDDLGMPYTFISGSVGGYPLTGFQRISATSYSAIFTIVQGGNSYTASENIPVSNFVISNGVDLSAPYNLPIVQSNDPLDAALPVISSMRVAGGNKKIGDIIDLIIEADGLNYSIDPGSYIYEIAVTEPNIAFTESGGGTYVLSYTVQEGDADMGPGSRELQTSVILKKPSGNIGMPYTTVTYTSPLTIDAHAPVVSRMEVPTTEVGVGGTVRVNVTTDGTGYISGPGTTVNGVPIDSDRVILTELSEGLYELTYVVGIEDAPVAPGMLQISIAMIDAAGNVGNTYSVLEPNNLEIYTDLPEVSLWGSPEVCEGDEAELYLNLTGRLPWSFDLNDGNTTTSFTNITSSDYTIPVSPGQNTTYQISSVTDVNGVVNNSIVEFQILVYEKSEVEIINLASGYNVEDDPVKLEANLPGGIFSGPGVISETGYFYPAVADTVNSPHTIYYSYENDNGCISTTSKVVYVLGEKGAILIPGSTFCSNDDPFIATVYNVPVPTGSFRLLNSTSIPVTGLTDHGDKTATIDPGLLNADEYTIEYQYFDGATLYLRKSFSVDSVVELQILHLNEGPFCQDEAPFELQANVSNVIFEGPGVTGNTNDGFIFNPGEAYPGVHSITCSTISDDGCMASTRESVEVLFSPEVNFELSSECVPEGGEMVSFNNQTTGQLSVETWSWDFGDLGSGENNYSNLINPTHHYRETGQKRISLTATTYEGCVAIYELDPIIDSKPVVDFTWISDCLGNGSGVKFVNRSTYGTASVDTIIWTFKNSDGDVLGKIGSNSVTDTVSFPFDMAGMYLVDLNTITSGHCASELSKAIVLRPSVQLNGEGYHESFNDTDGMWSVDSEDQVESWVWGVPDFTGYTQVSGDNAWFTQLPSGDAGYEENSWIQSPCFDFTDFDKPLIQMDRMQSFYPYLSGAVLQYHDVIEEGWKTIGENKPGINWYNFNNILIKPGGSSIGWGVEEFNPDTEWVTSVHDLDQVAGKPNVTLRLAFASNGRRGIGNQGFAVNNVVVAERSKIAVLEHFTNYTDITSGLADDIIDTYGIKHSREIIDLQYHTDFPEMDPMNENNPSPPSTRKFNYGVHQVPHTVLDGGVYSYHRYNYSELKDNLMEDHHALLTLEIPAFDIDLSVDWLGSIMTASTTVTCQADRYNEYIDLYLVVFETSVTAYTGPNGDTHFRNVVLDMLPTSAGKLLGNNWRKGNSDTRTNTWAYESYVENIDELAVAAFVQDRATGQILQAAVDYKDETVGIPNPESDRRNLNLYPNPSQSTIYVNLGDRTEYLGRVELSDMNGRVVLTENLPVGSKIIQLNIDPLDRGIYILRWIESEQFRGVIKFVKTR